MLIKSLKLTNFLSFGTDSEHIELRPLNVLVGPNGSGKSNFIEALGLLHRTPSREALAQAIRTGGGVAEYIWKGVRRTSGVRHEEGSISAGTDNTGATTAGETLHAATLEAILAFRPHKDPEHDSNLRHKISFAEIGQRFEIIDERIENEKPTIGEDRPFLYFGYDQGQPGQPMLNSKSNEGTRTLKRQSIHPSQSILAQFKDPELYPELSFISSAYEDIATYREWVFGPHSPLRAGQPADLPTDRLRESGRNLALILSRFRLDPPRKQRFVQALREVFEGAEDFSIPAQTNTLEIFLEEASGWSISSTRLSDGTLRWLWLIAMLLDPKPPRLLCIEEPELGLHPDLIPPLARLLKEASMHTQIIATTHSEVLVDALSKSPEDVVVCERDGGATTMQRLEKEKLAHWLDSYKPGQPTYKLGQLWSKGLIGGNRW